MEYINFWKRVRKNKMKKYDYLIVGSGLFGAVFAHEMTRVGKKCLVIDKREHILMKKLMLFHKKY